GIAGAALVLRRAGRGDNGRIHDGVELTPFSGHLISHGERSPRCRERDDRIRPSSGNKSSPWFVPDARRRSWPKSTSPPIRPFATGSSRRIATKASEPMA